MADRAVSVLQGCFILLDVQSVLNSEIVSNMGWYLIANFLPFSLLGFLDGTAASHWAPFRGLALAGSQICV